MAAGRGGSTMLSGALARRAGVSPDTLRFYERRGLLPRPPRGPNGYRRYPPEALQRVTMIQRALDAGFSLDDLTRILRQRDAGGAPCREVLSIAATRLRELDERILVLIRLRDRIADLVGEWQAKLDSTPAGMRARLLDTLAEADEFTSWRKRPSEAKRVARKERAGAAASEKASRGVRGA